MKTDKFERAKAIEREIANLVEYRRALDSTRSTTLSLMIHGQLNDRFPSQHYSHLSNECPAFLKEQIKDDLNFIADRLQAKINRRIADLETEFNNL